MNNFDNFGEQFGITPFEEEDMSRRAEYGAVADLGDPGGHLGLARQTVTEHFDLHKQTQRLHHEYWLSQYHEAMNDALLAHNNGDRIAAANHATRAHKLLLAATDSYILNHGFHHASELDNMADRHLHHINNYIKDLNRDLHHINNYIKAKKSGICRNCSTMRDTNGKCKGC